MKDKRYLHIGCGSNILPEPFENLDIRKFEGVDHVSQAYPLELFEDNTFDGKQGEGINVVTGEKTNMIKAGVIDPVLVTKSALKNAVSVVSTIISADCVISNMRYNESNK